MFQARISRIASIILLIFLSILFIGASKPRLQKKISANPPIYISFLWHMHQPIYWPYESVVQTDANSRYGYSVADIHNQRLGPYTSWPKNAVQKLIDAGLQHGGAQVSFSGSLIENLNNLEANGNGNFTNWKSNWNYIKNQKTSLNNPRIDMVGFGYFHPLMGLIDTYDIKAQIEKHKAMFTTNFPGTYSKGIFPPENAFSEREIPALSDESLQWVLVDNVHFDRSCQGYPFSTSGNLYEPNKADQRNPNPNDWVALNGLWAPTQNSARWGRQPHYVEYVDPNDGSSKKIIAVPADRYMGNEDGRGGFGALNYENVMSQLESYNTDPNHPILVVLHHDGDNYGGGTDSYYGSNFENFKNWLLANPSRFVCTTIQDYLDMFPPNPNDVIHVEDGSWSGADNGDPEFLKWNGDPASGYSPDRNSWGVITAAKNYVATANQINPGDPNTANAWKYLLCGEASDYWYWDGSQGGLWDSHPTRAANPAIQYAQAVINAGGSDLTPPTIYIPQRQPYNPGGTEWGIAQSNNFTIWTYIYDVSGLTSVTLKYRTDLDGSIGTDNKTYAGGGGVTGWTSATMAGAVITPQTNPLPSYKASEYTAPVNGLNNIMVDYYVEAVDNHGNIAKSPIQHVWVGANSGGGGGGGGGTSTVSWMPTSPTVDDSITITVTHVSQGAKFHWGVNNTGSSWVQPNGVYWTTGSFLFGGTGPAVESPMVGPDTAGTLTLTVGPFNKSAQSIQQIAFDIHYNDGTWNNNNNSDFHIALSGGGGGGGTPATFTMDGVLDTSARSVMTNAGITFYSAWNDTDLYVATQSAQSQGGDMFILLTDSLHTPVAAPWAKGGTVAGWKVFLANESSNNWCGWYNTSQGQISGSVASSAGTVLEGTINLQSIFGNVPSTLYVCVGKYGTADAGTLSAQVPTGNGNGNIEQNEYYAYSYNSIPVAPLVPVLAYPPSNIFDQPLSLILQWLSDSGAVSYQLQVATDSTFAAGMFLYQSSITDTSLNVSGLAQDTKYFWRVRARNSGGLSDWSATWNFKSILLLPAQVLLVSPASGAIIEADSAALRWRNTQLAVTSYRLKVGLDSLLSVLIKDDSTLSDTSIVVDSLIAPQSYWWEVKAKNAKGWGPVSARRKFTVIKQQNIQTIVASHHPFWNMESNPLVLPDDSVQALFPASSFPYAFTYVVGVGYAQRSTLEPGKGYWMKYPSSLIDTLTGIPLTAESISVSAGWNMIGSISTPVDTAQVTSAPMGIISSRFFGYQSSYVAAPTIEPGQAYWVKVEAPGWLILQSTSLKTGSKIK
jgi:hypothetical protein